MDCDLVSRSFSREACASLCTLFACIVRVITVQNTVNGVEAIDTISIPGPFRDVCFTLAPGVVFAIDAVNDGRKSIERQREDRDAPLEVLARYIPDTGAIVAADLFQARGTRRFIALSIGKASLVTSSRQDQEEADRRVRAVSQMRLRFLDAQPCAPTLGARRIDPPQVSDKPERRRGS